MSVESTLGVARRAWDLLWDRGKENEKQKEKTKKSKKTIRRQKRTKQTTQYQQTQMNGTNLDLDDVEYYGNEQRAKMDNIFRVGFHNIYNLSED
jgi:nitric oxide reductase activation protein